MEKYEVQVLMSKEEYLKPKLEELQKEGWQIAGDILIKNNSGWVNDTFVFIPMKRIMST